MTSNYKNTAMTKTWMAWCLALLAAAVITANPAHAGVGLAELPGQQGDGPVTVFYPAQEADQPAQRGPLRRRRAPRLHQHGGAHRMGRVLRASGVTASLRRDARDGPVHDAVKGRGEDTRLRK